jgi:hypothetical protein
MDMEHYVPDSKGEAEEMNSEIVEEKTEKTPKELAMDEQIEHYKFFDESLIPRDVLQAMRNKGLRNE